MRLAVVKQSFDCFYFQISVSADKEANVALDDYRNDPELQERVGQAIASGGGGKSKDDAETSSDVDEEEEEARLVERYSILSYHFRLHIRSR